MKLLTATAWGFWADGEMNWAGPDNWNSKYEPMHLLAHRESYQAEVGIRLQSREPPMNIHMGGTIVQIHSG